MFTLFNDAVNASASYYVIMHYRQPQSLSKKVEQLSITYYERLNISVTFHYCPTEHGCRVVIGEEENLTFRFSKGTFTAIIQHERRTHLVRKSKFDIFLIFTCIRHLPRARVYYEIGTWQAPSWLNSSLYRAPHRYRSVHGFFRIVFRRC